MDADLRPRMGALALGGWIGFLDTLVLAIALSGHNLDDRLGTTLTILLVAVMPGMLLGFILGAVCKSLAKLRIAARRAIVIAPPILVVGCIGMVARSEAWFYLVLVPMIGCSLYLEQRTRAGREVEVRAQPMRNSEAGARGVVIGSCNAIFIAIAMGLQEGREVAVLVLLFGIVPALVIGYLLGIVAGALHAQPVSVRGAVLVLVPVGLLLALAAALGLTDLFVPALIPTAVCGLVLERATRYVAELPPARARHISPG